MTDELRVIPLDPNKRGNADEFIVVLRDAIQKYIDEHDLPIAETVGSLELIKLAYAKQAFEEGEE